MYLVRLGLIHYNDGGLLDDTAAFFFGPVLSPLFRERGVPPFPVIAPLHLLGHVHQLVDLAQALLDLVVKPLVVRQLVRSHLACEVLHRLLETIGGPLELVVGLVPCVVHVWLVALVDALARVLGVD